MATILYPDFIILMMGYTTVYPGNKNFDKKALEEIEAVIPHGVSVKESDRVIYSKDYWPIALRWHLDGKLPALPDCIVWPENEEQVAGIIKIANENHIPVVPYGEGSGVLGGVVPVKGGIVVDMRKMDKVIAIDDESLMVTVQAGINGMNLERYLNHNGYTMGHIPQSLYCSSLGGWLACRAAGQFSTKYGKIEDIVVSMRAVLADGTIIQSKAVPRTSTGPRVERLLLGSEGTLGIITGAKLKIWPYPEERVLLSFAFDNLSRALEAVRKIMRKNVYPAVVRIYDENETLRHFQVKGKCMLILIMEGASELVKLERDVSVKICSEGGGDDTGEEPVNHWLETRFNVRESSEFVPKGFIFDTVEVSSGWKNALSLYKSVVKAMRGVEGVVIASAHASHFYPQGVCFYFTFGGLPPKNSTPFEFYEAVWDAIMRSCLDEGGSISHHHGIGIMRGKWLGEEMDGRFSMLEKIKRAIVPNSIMNPGKMGLADKEVKK